MSVPLPYTDEDLRAEAARQHAILTDEGNDLADVGRRMADQYIRYEVADQHGGLMPAPGTQRWDELSEDDFSTAQHKIYDLIDGAARVSQWAVDLAADGLEADGHTLQLGIQGSLAGDQDEPSVRMHFAFHPGMSDADRDRFVMRLSEVVLQNL